MIIDFHTHTFPKKISSQVVDKLSEVSCTVHFTDGSQDGLKASMKQAGIDYSLVLPVATSPGQVEKINSGIIESMETLMSEGFISFGCMHPDYPDFKRELDRLKAAGIRGIKLHPTYQGMDLTDIRMMRVIYAASEAGLAVIIHAGWDIGIFDHDFASVDMILKIIDEICPHDFILAHFGGWLNWDKVEKYLAGADVYMDTAFTVGDVTPLPGAPRPPFSTRNLDNESFLRIMRKHGADRVLFATDSPWMDQSEYVRIFNEMPLSPSEREHIMHLNAERLLGLRS